MAKEITQEYSKALELHNKILISAQLAQKNLWDMCTSLKEMRDGKLYKELGYQNFEDYCGSEFKFSRIQAHKYISIVENSTVENVNSSLHFGVTKLYLLSTLSQAEQEKITEENNVNELSVRELESKIKALKSRNSELEQDVEQLISEKDELSKSERSGKKEIESLRGDLSSCRQRIEELENRPIEVEASEPGDNERLLRDTIKSLERKNIEQYDELERQYREDEKAVRKMLEQEKRDALRELSEEYEEKLRKAASAASPADDREVFRAYFTAAYDTMNRMLNFAKESRDKSFFAEKINNLLTSFSNAVSEM